MKRDGFLETFEKLGGTVFVKLLRSLHRTVEAGRRCQGACGLHCQFVQSQFPGRNDGISETLSFLASPEVVTAYAITGDLGFDPVNQSVKGRTGRNSSFSRRLERNCPLRVLPKVKKVSWHRQKMVRI